MDKLQFAASVIGSLAWPVAVVFLGFMFRAQLRALLNKVKHAKGAGIELDFTEDVKRIVAEGEHVKQEALAVPEAPDGMALPAPNQAEQREELYRLLRERPSALILDSWRDLERTTEQIIDAVGLNVGFAAKRNSPPSFWPGFLQKNGFLTHEEAALLTDLRQLRNKVAHAIDWEPTVTDALDYHRTATLLTSVLKQKLKEILELKQ
jgi:hypothetical protein